MNTVDLICEKARSLPGKLQSEALGFVEYLARRCAAQTETAGWQSWLRDSQTLSAAQRITDDDIAVEIAAHRSG